MRCCFRVVADATLFDCCRRFADATAAAAIITPSLRQLMPGAAFYMPMPRHFSYYYLYYDAMIRQLAAAFIAMLLPFATGIIWHRIV